MLSSPREREGGFTFEVQQELGEGFGGSSEVKALSRDGVVSAEEGEEAVVGESGEIGLARDEAPEAPDGILDAAFQGTQ